MCSIEHPHVFRNIRAFRENLRQYCRAAGWPAIVLACWLALPGAARCEEIFVPEQCPLRTPPLQAELVATSYAGRVGQRVEIGVRLTPATPPDGFFTTAVIEVLDGPPGPAPTILTGVPTSDVTPQAAGTYRLQVLVHLVAKSSCGGVKAVLLLDREVLLTAH